jgi:hypothetical protein
MNDLIDIVLSSYFALGMFMYGYKSGKNPTDYDVWGEMTHAVVTVWFWPYIIWKGLKNET